MSSEKTASQKDGKKAEYLDSRSAEKTIRNILILLVITIVLAIVGLCLSIHATIQADRALRYLDQDGIIDEVESSSKELSEEELSNDVTDEDELSFGLPSSKDSIEYVAIIYNDGRDFIDIIKDDEEGSTIEYYAYNDNDEYVGDSESIDVSNIFQYVIDHDIQYLGDNEYSGNEAWGIEVSSTEGFSFVGGTDNAPDWFNDLLKELDVDQKGYKSNNS